MKTLEQKLAELSPEERAEHEADFAKVAAEYAAGRQLGSPWEDGDAEAIRDGYVSAAHKRRGEWRPISSAPKGVAILICAEGAPDSVWIAKDKGIRKQIWFHGAHGEGRLRLTATHWQPLPEPPK